MEVYTAHYFKETESVQFPMVRYLFTCIYLMSSKPCFLCYGIITPPRLNLSFGEEPRKKGFLILENGTVFEGVQFGWDGDTYGEVVFTTSMTGYLESITDPSYCNQILVFASPTIGNYSISKGCMESPRAMVSGMITRDGHSVLPGGEDWESFRSFLIENHIPALDQIDTRTLVRTIRENGVLRGWISSRKELKRDFPDPMAEDIVSRISPTGGSVIKGSGVDRILFIDVGSKNSLRNEVLKIGTIQVESVLSDFKNVGDDYSLIFVSNGPGDPSHASLRPVIEFLRESAGKVPIAGVCLGHQLLGISMGANTMKMKFGHRGSNHAVSDGKKIMITTHNHGYSIVPETLSGTGLTATQWDVNDRTVERMENRKMKILSVQYHPEASPGPHDARIFFEEVKNMVRDS